MKGNWQVTSNVIGGKRMYAVMRILDISKPLHSGNCEFASSYVEDKEVAEKQADDLNREV